MRKWLLMLVACYCAAIAAGAVIWGRGNPRRWTGAEASWTDTNSAHLVSHWNVDTTNTTGLVDVSTNVNDLTTFPAGKMVPIEVAGTNQNGRVELCLRKYGDTTNYFWGNATLIPTGAAVRTWCLWYKPHTGAAGVDSLWYHGTATATRHWETAWDVTTDADVYHSINATAVRTPTGAAPSNVWTHIAVVYTGGAMTTNTMLVYTNALPSSTILIGSSVVLNTSTDSLWICVGPAAGLGAHGWMDDIRIYDIAISTGHLAQVVANTHPTNNIEARP